MEDKRQACFATNEAELRVCKNIAFFLGSLCKECASQAGSTAKTFNHLRG